MKKSTLVAIIVIVLVIIGIILFGRGKSDNGSNSNPANIAPVSSTTASTFVPSTETTKVSSKTSKYENDELGFSVNYPTTWEADNTNTGISFIMPIDTTQVSTVAKLQADITVVAKCAFPPVTTIKDRGTIKVGDSSLDMISMTNNVQGRVYFNRMYSLQKGNICYLFSFSSITLSPESKGLTGSNITQAQNNNKAIVNSADTDFTNMVKTYATVQGPVGQDESTVPPVK